MVHRGGKRQKNAEGIFSFVFCQAQLSKSNKDKAQLSKSNKDKAQLSKSHHNLS